MGKGGGGVLMRDCWGEGGAEINFDDVGKDDTLCLDAGDLDPRSRYRLPGLPPALMDSPSASSFNSV